MVDGVLVRNDVVSCRLATFVFAVLQPCLPPPPMRNDVVSLVGLPRFCCATTLPSPYFFLSSFGRQYNSLCRLPRKGSYCVLATSLLCYNAAAPPPPFLWTCLENMPTKYWLLFLCACNGFAVLELVSPIWRISGHIAFYFFSCIYSTSLLCAAPPPPVFFALVPRMVSCGRWLIINAVHRLYPCHAFFCCATPPLLPLIGDFR